MELADWGDRWRDGRIAFHQSHVTDLLAEYAEQVWGAGSVGRVLVPLCGKSLDMVFLADRADAVVGVEYAEQAVKDFFAEQGLAPTTGTGPPVRYSADNYTLFVSDFFAVTNEQLGVVDAVFDRAALVALDADTRAKYANHIQSLVSTGAKTILITFDYDQTQMHGPPFAVSSDEVERLFRGGFAVELLETRDVLEPVFRERGLNAMTESAFALTRL
jgi:thiopurine S-methyltransferase